MRDVSRITIGLPSGLLQAADERLRRGGEDRSGMIRRLLEDAVREEQEREDIQRYIRAYREQPQTYEESGWHDAVNVEMARGLLGEERHHVVSSKLGRKQSEDHGVPDKNLAH